MSKLISYQFEKKMQLGLLKILDHSSLLNVEGGNWTLFTLLLGWIFLNTHCPLMIPVNVCSSSCLLHCLLGLVSSDRSSICLPIATFSTTKNLTLILIVAKSDFAFGNWIFQEYFFESPGVFFRIALEHFLTFTV